VIGSQTGSSATDPEAPDNAPGGGVSASVLRMDRRVVVKSASSSSDPEGAQPRALL